MSLRDRILAHDDIGSKVVSVKAWGDMKLELRTMTAGRRGQMMKAAMGEDGTVDMTALWPMLIVASAYDPKSGEAIFTMDDIEALQEKSAAAIEFLGGEAMALSGMSGDPVDDAGKAP